MLFTSTFGGLVPTWLARSVNRRGAIAPTRPVVPPFAAGTRRRHGRIDTLNVHMLKDIGLAVEPHAHKAGLKRCFCHRVMAATPWRPLRN